MPKYKVQISVVEGGEETPIKEVEVETREEAVEKALEELRDFMVNTPAHIQHQRINIEPVKE